MLFEHIQKNLITHLLQFGILSHTCNNKITPITLLIQYNFRPSIINLQNQLMKARRQNKVQNQLMSSIPTFHHLTLLSNTNLDSTTK